jgi:FkbM family methyltransferase
MLDRLASLIESPVKRILARWGYRHNYAAGLLFDLFEGTYSVRGCEIDVPDELTDRPFRSRFFFDVYEEVEVDFVSRYVRPDDAVLEIGGCLGVVSCVTNRWLDDPTQHVVVEANPELIPWLTRNRDRNGCQFQVKHALVSDDSDATFHVHPLVVGGSATRSTGREAHVPVRSFANVLSADDVSFTGCILDVEGSEHDLITQNAALFERLRFVIVEFHDHIGIIAPEEAEACRAVLRDAGLRQRETRMQVEAWTR